MCFDYQYIDTVLMCVCVFLFVVSIVAFVLFMIDDFLWLMFYLLILQSRVCGELCVFGRTQR